SAASSSRASTRSTARCRATGRAAWRGRWSSAEPLRPRPQAEPAQQQQRGLAEAAAGGQQAELDRDVVEVEEAAGAADQPVGELDIVDAVDDDEAVRRRQRAALAPVG